MITINPWTSIRIASSRTIWTVMACDATGEVIRGRRDITDEVVQAAWSAFNAAGEAMRAALAAADAKRAELEGQA